ncbi:MAG TPA: tripartite tricarboxylate transporter substrate binding protein [Xanthobacteraceae bacterium]|nr:tripartite tricarboxylate transporter substrate binding protein [Xanthobacteraceae bacterium]
MHREMMAAVVGALIASFVAAPVGQARAQDYPTHPITLIVPYPAGGGVDLIGRLVGQRLSAALGQQVVVENRGGAGGMIGTRDIAKATPDGYTLGVMLTGISLSPNAGYDINKDFSPIGSIATTPMFVVANPSLPVKSLTDIVALAKKEPGKISVGTPPSPTLNYFTAKLLDLVGGIDTITVTYRGTAPLTTDLIGGQVQLGIDTIPAAISNVQAGQLRAIAVTGLTRSAALPNVPTSAQSGLPEFQAVQYYGLTAPAGVPRPIVDRLNKELRTMLAADDFKKRLIEAGDDPAPSTPEEYAASIKREEGKWAALVKKLGLKVE